MCSRDGPAENGDEQPDKNDRKLSSSKNRAVNGERVRDRNGYRQRAAAFCARLSTPEDNHEEEDSDVSILQSVKKAPPGPARLEVLMVSGRREGSGQNYWVLPGGGVENLESTEQAVVRELHEEAGILGKVLFLIGKFIDEQRFHHTTLYFLTVQETFDVWENCQNGRERRWMGMEEARRSIKTNQLAMLEQSIGVIEQTLSEHSNAVGGVGHHHLLLATRVDGGDALRPATATTTVVLQQQQQSLLMTNTSKLSPCMTKSASLD